jgi:hypothetical protein
MSTKHTPAPWKATPVSGVDCSYEITGNGGAVALIYRRFEDEAHARLVAAAPELLEALKWFVANDETNEGDEPLIEHGNRSWNELNAYWIEGKRAAVAAIAKAEGI